MSRGRRTAHIVPGYAMNVGRVGRNDPFRSSEAVKCTIGRRTPLNLQRGQFQDLGCIRVVASGFQIIEHESPASQRLTAHQQQLTEPPGLGAGAVAERADISYTEADTILASLDRLATSDNERISGRAASIR
jgi:hypothetical protein